MCRHPAAPARPPSGACLHLPDFEPQTACRLGSNKSIGPNAQLEIFHDGNALVGVALAIALHGSGALWPLSFLVNGKLLVHGCQALRLRLAIACGLVWAYAAAALLVNNASEGAGAAFWCLQLPGGGAAWLPLAAVADSFTGVAPVHFTVGVTFRYMLMRYIRCARTHGGGPLWVLPGAVPSSRWQAG
jgi:hypothetical protein